MEKVVKAMSFIVILSVVLFSCGTEQSVTGDAENSAAAAGSQDIRDDAEAPEAVTHDVPAIDFDGHNFISLVRDGHGIFWRTVDVFAEEETGEPINDAVFRRNRMLEAKFNIDITEIRREDVASFAQTLILAGDEAFDVMYPTMHGAGHLIQRGFLLNLHEMPHLNFDKPWWNRSINDSVTVGGRLFAAAGNITTMTNDATWVALFNKDLAEDFGLADHYQLVEDGKWTLDVLHENARAATLDLSGDGILTPADQWGAIGQHEVSFSLFAASGQRIVESGADGLPSLVLNNERTVSVLTRVIDFMTDTSAYINADDFHDQFENVWVSITTNVFNESRALYLITNIEIVKSLRGMEANFGILPLPKIDELQENYYSTMQYNNASIMAVPITASNQERTGAILEAWAAKSVETLTRAYYDITLKSQFARDDESEAMLDLIFATRVVDKGMFFNWSGIQGFFEGFSRNPQLSFASQYERLEPRLLIEIERTLEAIEENN